MKTTLSYVYLLLVGIAALYVGLSGWVVADLDARLDVEFREGKSAGGPVIFQGISFDNVAAARLAAEEDKINRYFQWVYRVPPGLPLVFTALAFGVLGGVASILHKLARGTIARPTQIYFRPLLGGVIGLMVFGICTTMPKLIVDTAEGVRPVSIIFLCLFAGTFSSHVYKWVEERVKIVFPLSAQPTQEQAAGSAATPSESPKP